MTGAAGCAEPLGYRMIRGLTRLLLGLFYQRVEVVAPDRIPAHGPLILAANHQNALVDPMLLLVAVPRRLSPIAKAPLFHHPLIGPFLRLARAIPVHRRQDVGSDPARNEAMFSAATTRLAEGGAVLIFPEGVSQAEPTLMPLRTGTARLLLAAEAAADGRLGVRLVPVGLVFHEPGTFRIGSALVLAGTPVPTDDCIALHATAPAEAVRRLTDRLADALRALIVETNDRQALRLLTVSEAVWREESRGPADDPAARAAWLRRASRAYRYLSSHEPRRVAALLAEVERYAKDLDLAGASERELWRSWRRAAAWRHVLREGSALLVGLPLAMWGLLTHGAPYRLTALVVRWLRPSADAEATFKLAAGLVLYPFCWLAEAWVAWRLLGAWGLGGFVAAFVPAGFFALTWWERFARARREARGYLRFLRDRDLRARLLAQRRALRDELEALERMVPDA